MHFHNGRVEISRLEISLKAQDKANAELCKLEKQMKIKHLNFFNALQNPELLHIYLLNLTMGAIEEYHQQLREALKEQGILIDNFIELPLYPSKNSCD